MTSCCHPGTASAELTPDGLQRVRPDLPGLGRGSCGQTESITQKGSTEPPPLFADPAPASIVSLASAKAPTACAGTAACQPCPWTHLVPPAPEGQPPALLSSRAAHSGPWPVDFHSLPTDLTGSSGGRDIKGLPPVSCSLGRWPPALFWSHSPHAPQSPVLAQWVVMT